MRKKLEAIPSTATDHERWEQKRELRIAEKMLEICQGDGQLMDTILNGEIFDVVDLEGALTSVADAVCHKRNFFHGIASQLALTFTPEQRRILAYLLWKPRLVDRKRGRKQMAAHFLLLEDLRRAEKGSRKIELTLNDHALWAGMILVATRGCGSPRPVIRLVYHGT